MRKSVLPYVPYSSSTLRATPVVHTSIIIDGRGIVKGKVTVGSAPSLILLQCNRRVDENMQKIIDEQSAVLKIGEQNKEELQAVENNLQSIVDIMGAL